MSSKETTNLYREEHLSPEKRTRLQCKVYEYITQEYLNPKLINFLADFIKTYEIHFTEKPIEESRLAKRERLMIESTQLPILCVGIFELLEVQRNESKKENGEKIQDEEILKIIGILCSLLNITNENSQEIKKRAKEFFENRKNLETFSKDPDFTKKIIKDLLTKFGKLSDVFRGSGSNISSKKTINDEEVNSILNSSEYTGESIVGPTFCISEKYPLLLSADGLKTIVEYKGKKVKISILPKLLREIKSKQELRDRKNTTDHEAFHIIKDFLKINEMLSFEMLVNQTKNINEQIFLETMIEPLNYKIIDEIYAHLGGFRDYYVETSTNKSDEKSKNAYLDYLNNFLINNLKNNYLTTNEKMFVRTFKEMVRDQGQFNKFVRKNTELMSNLIENIFDLMKKYYQHVDLIMFTIGISDENTIHKNIKRLETFLKKYSARK